MCGIVGSLSLNNANQIDSENLLKMRDSMFHRGPDGGGIWISPHRFVGLAHRRLSIVDLDPSAAQPMTNEDSSICLVFNGEIYNHLELRKELIKCGYRFKTDHSDTEVLVHGYREWGLNRLLHRLNGDYAFAIWDSLKQKLLLARDRVGVKPLYFYLDNSQFCFASEIKAILANSSIKRDVEPIAMYHYLSFLTTPAPLTRFKGVFKLPAGHAMTVDLQGVIKSWRYWDAVPGRGIQSEQTKNLSDSAKEDFYVTGIRQRLEASVERRMMSDVPFGVFLSGGVDSSTNVALMSQLMDRPVDSFTVGFKDYDHLNELEYAEQISNLYNTNHHQILIDEKDMIGYLDQLIHHQDEPIADWVCIPLYFVSKLARDSGVTVIQVGEGSDEQFCGYTSYMEYLKLYNKYWSPFQNYIPKTLQHLAAASAKQLSRFKFGYSMYADIIDRASRNREHFWTGATVFWDVLKSQLLNNSANWSTDIPQAIKESGFYPRLILIQTVITLFLLS